MFEDLFLQMNALRNLLAFSSAMTSRHSYGPAATGDSTDEEDQPFINAELSEKKFSQKKAAVLGTTTFSRVMGLVNVVLALMLAVVLALLAVSETHRKDVTEVSVPYCWSSSATLALS